MIIESSVETSTAINSFPLLTEREHQSLVIDYNNSAAPYPADKTIIDLFIAQVARTPGDNAICLGDQSLTYRELDERANQMAAHLHTYGVGRGQLVVLCMEHSIEVVCAMLGVLKAGAAYVPVDPATPAERLAFMLQDIREGLAGVLPVLVTQSRLVSRLPSGVAQVVTLNADFASIGKYPVSSPGFPVFPNDLAYVIYTSGSTGTPKGVMIDHRSLVNYIWWANEKYCRGERLTWPLFSSLAFDLTVTSIFTPLISGGRIIVYRGDPEAHGMVIFKVFEDNVADIVKLTPAHLGMIKDMNLRATKIRKFILGGEDLKTELARDITQKMDHAVEIYNEYGPTEATVGCMIHRYDIEKDLALSVPIGTPAANVGVYILDQHLRPVPTSVIGEMYIAGDGLARGYFNRPDLTAQRFLTTEDPRHNGTVGQSSAIRPTLLRVYKTGDLARWSADGRMEFLGRADQQVKVGGARIELGEIEARLLKHPDVRQCVVDVVNSVSAKASEDLHYCTRCGIASNVPGTSYDAEGVCNLCRGYDTYVDKAQAYFKTRDEFKALVAEMKAARSGDYDCVVLYSGGKDSTYMLYQLCGLGLKPLVFSLDNGFISEEAKANIRRVVQSLGVELVFGKTLYMNEIFVDSLKHFANVCNGCFKTIYTLATNLAREKNIRYIVTGLSRGQFFETRLTEEVFQRKDFHVDKLDALVLQARKAYHRREDAVSCRLAVDVVRDEGVLDDIQFVDFYRYWSVSLEEMYAFLHKYASWVRPSDTGRSTNCLINEVGIYLHKKQRGFHNYSLPYSWDVRLGQKTRSEAMAELDDEIDEERVKRIMAKIGYTEPPQTDETGINRLVAYYVSDKSLTVGELRAHLAKELPDYMLPAYFIGLETLPLTSNGKVDRRALPAPSSENIQPAHDLVRPRTEIEKALSVIWTELLNVDSIGINDDFFELGGHSLLAIRAVSRIRDMFEVEIPLEVMFANPTIARLANALSEAKGSSGKIQRTEQHKQGGSYPLSFAQEQLWFLDQLVPGSPVYNMSDVIPIEGTYDAKAMRKAMNELVRRHEILRTAFSRSNGQPIQYVLPTIDFLLSELDLSSLSEQAREGEWIRLVREQGRKPFELSQAPLLRATMVHRTKQDHQLLLTIHHIIADEWSMEVIHQEVNELYKAFSQDQPSPLPEVPIQYADFACWQRDWLQGEVMQGQLAYWKEELAGASRILELPTDKPRPAMQSFRGATEIFELPKELVERLRSIGRQQQATLFMILEASFAALLHRYTGQNDILVGTPISSRTHRETEGLIGCFLNTVVLRTRFTHNLDFRSLLQQVRERALGAYTHPHLPFEHLVAELATERDPSLTPLFQVMFILHNSEGVSQVSKVSGNRQLETGTSKFDLTLLISETANGLEGLIEYSTDLFEADTIRRLCGHYGILLDAIAREPGQSISTLPMLSATERQQLLVDWNDTAASYPGEGLCLHQLIEEQAARTPDQLAVVFGRQTLTYGELNRRSDQLAHHLRRLGVGPDVLVGLFLERSLEMVVGLVGILKSGGAYVPLDPAFPPNRLAQMIEDSSMSVLVTDRQCEERLRTRPPIVVRIDSDWGRIDKEESLEGSCPSATGKNLAYVLYTSGSTGRPKGVGIPHSAIVNFLLSMQRSPGFGAHDTLLAVTTLSFDIAGLELYLPLVTGGKAVIASDEDIHDPARLLKLMHDSGCTVMQATPATWRALIHAGWSGSRDLTVLCGGEALSSDLAKDLLARCARLWNMYGPTETTVWSTLHGVTSADSPVRIGRPIDNTQVYVLDPNRNLVPVGVNGELYIGGAGLARGYLNREDLTRERFVASPFVPNAILYRTGDLARWHSDGTLECLGRLDSQVKIRGFRVELGEIETVLSAHNAIRQCAVGATEDAVGEKQLVAYFEVKGDSMPAVDELRAHLEKQLPGYMVPSLFVRVEKLPLTPNGKIDRKALPSAGDCLESASQFVAPRDPLEQLLAQIWAQMLKVKRLGVMDNFFELGGHSLIAVRLMVEIERVCKIRIPLATLLQSPTIAGLAASLRREHWKPDWSSLVPIRPGGARPLLFLMHAHGGNVLEYYPLVSRLDPDQPVYALQARGLDGHIERDSSLEKMAAAYINELRRLQPEGPYFLGGFCFGGLLALEAAQQLAEAGQEVALLVLIQSMHPRYVHFKPSITLLHRWWYRTTKRISLELENWSCRGRGYIEERCRRAWDRARARVAIAFYDVTGTGPQSGARLPLYYILEALAIEHGKALEKYSPRPYSGDVILFRASKQLSGLLADECLGWKDTLRGVLDVCTVPGHQQNLLLEPNVSTLAAELNRRLQAAQKRHSVKAAGS